MVFINIQTLTISIPLVSIAIHKNPSLDFKFFFKINLQIEIPSYLADNNILEVGHPVS